MVIAGAAAGVAFWLTLSWLLGSTTTALDRDAKATGAERAGSRVEVVRTALAAGAGAGAAVGLMLSFRRQIHQEYDTAERRVTELYNAAAEQLGSDKAPVRLTALYTLERLANDEPRHRQTIVNIICSYLRMPYSPPESATAESVERAARQQATRRYHAARIGAPHAAPPEPGPDPQEELQVRLTAQRILHLHFRADAAVRWSGINLDLTEATLVGFTLEGCSLASADFRRAVFHDIAIFTDATFHGPARFDGARFEGEPRAAQFDRTTFYGPMGFSGAVFGQWTSMYGAAFHDHTFFDGAVFRGGVGFDDASFHDVAYLAEIKASGAVSFRKVAFRKLVRFDKAAFHGDVDFERAIFGDMTIFSGVNFYQEAIFRRVAFDLMGFFNGATFHGPASFDEARFRLVMTTGGVLDDAVVADRDLPHQLPPGWRIEPAEGATGRMVQISPEPGDGDNGSG